MADQVDQARLQTLAMQKRLVRERAVETSLIRELEAARDECARVIVLAHNVSPLHTYSHLDRYWYS